MGIERISLVAVYKLKEKNPFFPGYPIIEEWTYRVTVEVGKYTNEQLHNFAIEASPKYYEFDRITDDHGNTLI